jgi:hypothetical protein
MPKYFGALTIILLLGMVLTRVFLLKRQGIKAMKFGNIDNTDFLIVRLWVSNLRLQTETGLSRSFILFSPKKGAHP